MRGRRKARKGWKGEEIDEVKKAQKLEMCREIKDQRERDRLRICSSCNHRTKKKNERPASKEKGREK